MSIRDAAQEGHLEALEAMRDKLASDMDAAEPAVVAQIAGRLQAVLSDIEAIRKAEPAEVSKVDELRDRRTQRDAAPKRRQTPTRQRR
jgi:hypothetical protein